jgi:hypothetical protein
MKEKKLVTIISRIMLSCFVLSFTVNFPIGDVKAGTLEQEIDLSITVKQPEDNLYENKALIAPNDLGVLKMNNSTMIGDVNCDGDVNSIDFAYMRMSLLGKRSDLITVENISSADVNCDGNFNSLDFAIMRGYLLGKMTGFPIGNNVPPPKPSATAAVPTPLPSSKTDDYTDDISKASYSVSVGVEVHGKINYEGDQDYMIFVPPSDGQYRVDIYTRTETTIGYLYVEKIEGLKYSYNSFSTYTSNDENCYVKENLTGGTKYYIGVKNRKGKVSLDSYTIKITKLR